MLLLFIFLFVFLPSSIHAARSEEPIRYHESGELTEIEDSDTVIIDDRGYTVDPSVHVVNNAGRPTSLDKLILPTKVNFKYSYMESAPKTMSPVVVYIEETVENERNIQ